MNSEDMESLFGDRLKNYTPLELLCEYCDSGPNGPNNCNSGERVEKSDRKWCHDLKILKERFEIDYPAVRHIHTGNRWRVQEIKDNPRLILEIIYSVKPED